jgi:hypothetical protein
VEEKTSIAKQQSCKHVYAATEADETVKELLKKKHATIQELLEAVFSIQSILRLHTRDQNGAAVSG